MKDITVVIQVFNEQESIVECVKSALLLSKNVMVMDMQSTDKTVIRAKQAGATIIKIPNSPYVEPVRKYAFSKINSTWIFILDADERITEELATEIKTEVKQTKYTYFKIPRMNIFAGKKWLKHGGWWRDYQIRLIKKSAFIKWPNQIHSTVQIKGEPKKLVSPIKHYFHPNLENMVNKTLKFEDIESNLLFKANKKVNSLIIIRKFFGELYRRLIKNLGFLDGPYGIVESFYQAYSKTITWIMLYEKQFYNTKKNG